MECRVNQPGVNGKSNGPDDVRAVMTETWFRRLLGGRRGQLHEVELEPLRTPGGVDGPGGDEEDEGEREAADDLGLVVALGAGVEEADRAEREDRVEPGDRPGGEEQGDQAEDEVDVDEHGDDALEDRPRSFDQGDDDDAALPPDLADSFGQLDLLLREIRMDAEEA